MYGRPALSDACQLLVSAEKRAINSIGLTLAQRHLSVEKLTAARGKVNAYVGKTKAKIITLAVVLAKAKILTLADVLAKAKRLTLAEVPAKAKRLTLADVPAKAKRLTLADVSAKVSAIIDKKQR